MNIYFQGLLQSTCSVLGFEVGEIWFARKQPSKLSYLLLYYIILCLFSFIILFIIIILI